MGDVFQMPGIVAAQEPEGPYVNENAIAAIEDLLADLRSGAMQSVAYVAAGPLMLGAIGISRSIGDAYKMIGKMEGLKRRLLDAVDENE